MADEPRVVVLAAIAGAHGIAGEVRLKLFGDGAEQLQSYGKFNNSALTLVKLREDGKGGAIARFAEVDNRNAAEALRGTPLSVPRTSLPPLAEGEYYHADLIGLAAVGEDGLALGAVVAVANYGAGDVIEIQRPDNSRFMVPMRTEAVPAWDAVRLVVARGWAEG